LSVEFNSLLDDIIGSKMHCNNIRGVRLQPPIELVLIRDIDSKKPAVAFIVAVVLGVSAVVLCFPAADPVHGRPFSGLETFPELGAPADDLGDAVAEGHEADGRVGRLGGRGSCDGSEEEQLEGDHDGGGSEISHGGFLKM
jgi:hypothetical protein